MADDETLSGDDGPGEHDARLLDDDPAETTPCPRCGKYLWAYTQQCHHCGEHFPGEAWQSAPTGKAKVPVGMWWPTIAVLVVMAIVLAMWCW
jgi:hypothetical protein